ncbi:hypothetical protein Taro_000063 [Colocasia esculenta]|uniref:Uncharacterized protein n=1 Tax=Colocasia esculenta TaxID=4460 RepID=A0A843TGE7_COLES|nr:hypothetical protein [Colocasia esculenta]
MLTRIRPFISGFDLTQILQLPEFQIRIQISKDPTRIRSIDRATHDHQIKEIVALKAEKEKMTNELEVVIKQSQNFEKRISELNKTVEGLKIALSKFVQGSKNLDNLLGIKVKFQKESLGFNPLNKKDLENKTKTSFVNVSKNKNSVAPKEKSTKVHVQRNVQKQSNNLNKNAAKRKNHVSIENQEKKMEKKTELYKVSTSPPAAKKASGHSLIAHHAMRYQRVPPPPFQPKGDQMYSRGLQKFQQMHSYYGVNAYKRSIKIQVQKTKKNTSSGHVSTVKKFPIDRYTYPEQTSYWKLKWSSSCRQLKTACRQPAIACRQIRPFHQDHGFGKPEVSLSAGSS